MDDQSPTPSKTDYLVIDLEFTQYRRPIGKPRGFFAEIIEIGAVKHNVTDFQNLGSIQDFVKPHFYPKQAKEAMEFCSITEADMKTAITFHQMLEKINQLYIPQQTYIVAWGNEDYNVLNMGCQRHDVPNPILQSDYLDLAKAYRLLQGNGYTTSLRQAAEELEVEESGHWHAAFEDAVKTANILQKLIQQGYDPAQPLS